MVGEGQTKWNFFHCACVSERESERDSVITHHYSMENLIHSFDNCNYRWQAASLSHHEPQTRSSLALQFSFLLTPVVLLDRYGLWQWSDVIWSSRWHPYHTYCTHTHTLLLLRSDNNSCGIMAKLADVWMMVWTQRTKKLFICTYKLNRLYQHECFLSLVQFRSFIE